MVKAKGTIGVIVRTASCKTAPLEKGTTSIDFTFPKLFPMSARDWISGAEVDTVARPGLKKTPVGSVIGFYRLRAFPDSCGYPSHYFSQRAAILFVYIHKPTTLDHQNLRRADKADLHFILTSGFFNHNAIPHRRLSPTENKFLQSGTDTLSSLIYKNLTCKTDA